MTQKFPVHSEYDKDILLEGTCVSIPLTDLTRFVDQDKVSSEGISKNYSFFSLKRKFSKYSKNNSFERNFERNWGIFLKEDLFFRGFL